MAIDKTRMEEALRRNLDLLERKNADYSSDNIRIGGSRGVVVRLIDKVSRLRNLLDKPEEEINFESVLDTFGDVANYGLIGQLLESGGWSADVQRVLITGDDFDVRNRIQTLLTEEGVNWAYLRYIWRNYDGVCTANRVETVERLAPMFDAVVVTGYIMADTMREIEAMIRTNPEARRVYIGDEMQECLYDFEYYESPEKAFFSLCRGGMAPEEVSEDEGQEDTSEGLGEGEV